MTQLDIIIPAYKAGKKIKPALDSLRAQTNKDFNVCIVMDGYDKLTDDVIRDNALFFYDCKGFSVHSPEHGGVGYARNYGIDHTHAPYIMFLDCDDMLLPNAVQTVYNAIDMGFDFMVGKTMREAQNGNFEVVGSQQITWVHGRAYRREFLRQYGIRFPELPMCEDLTFNMLCTEFAEKIPEAQWPIHIQRYTEGSISRSENSMRLQASTYIAACLEYLRQAKKYKPVEELRLLPDSLAACYWYIDGADIVYPEDKNLKLLMAKQFVELIEESGYDENIEIRKLIPKALTIPVRPFGEWLPQTLTFEQRIVDAMSTVRNAK